MELNDNNDNTSLFYFGVIRNETGNKGNEKNADIRLNVVKVVQRLLSYSANECR
jgi:hypothetical protein